MLLPLGTRRTEKCCTTVGGVEEAGRRGGSATAWRVLAGGRGLSAAKALGNQGRRSGCVFCQAFSVAHGGLQAELVWIMVLKTLTLAPRHAKSNGTTTGGNAHQAQPSRTAGLTTQFWGQSPP